MRRTLTIILSAAAIVAVTGGAITFARAEAEEQQFTLPAEFTDLAAIAAIEVRDASGSVVLHGTFAGTPEADGNLERKAKLAAKDGSAATGEAEIEIEKSEKTGAVKVEVDLDVAKLAASTAYSFHLDGRLAASFTTDAKGEAEVELVSAGQ